MCALGGRAPLARIGRNGGKQYAVRIATQASERHPLPTG
jgi:hypothetical protein